MAGGDASICGPAKGRLHIADADVGFGQCIPDRDHTHGGTGHAVEPSERVQADPGDPDAIHGWNTQVTVGSSSGPGTTSPSSCIGIPMARLSPARRDTTRSNGPPSSSTMPSW